MTRRARRMERRKAITGFLLDFGVYLFIFGGIFLARYIDEFKGAGAMSFADWTWHRTVFGMLVAFMIVDEETSWDVRASAQGLFNLIVVGFGVIAGNYFAGQVAQAAESNAGTDYGLLFGIPALVAVACLLLLLWRYPRKGAGATA